MFRPLITLSFLIFLFGCSKNKKQTEVEENFLPEKKPLSTAIPVQPTKQEIKEAPKPLEPSADIINLKRGQTYKYGNLLVSIDEVTNQGLWYSEYNGAQSYFDATRVTIKLQNTSEVKIEDWQGWYYKGTLNDEHGNAFKYKPTVNWFFESQPPDYGARINPGKTLYTSLFFEGIPKTSKEFILKLPLNGKILIWKGILGEKAKLEYEKNKKEFEDKKEKERLEFLTKEAARKKDQEERGLAYYPLPSTNKVSDKDINEWYTLLCKTQDPATLSASLEALKSYGDPGVPFLLEALKTQSAPKARELILLALYPNSIHPNDLPKIVECLSKSKEQIGTRVMALSLLAKNNNSKKYWDKIEPMTKDLLNNKNVKDQVKSYIDKIK